MANVLINDGGKLTQDLEELMMDEEISDASFRTRPPEELPMVQVPLIQTSPPLVLPALGMPNVAGEMLTSSPMALHPIVGAVEALGQQVAQGMNALVRTDEALQRADARDNKMPEAADWKKSRMPCMLS